MKGVDNAPAALAPSGNVAVSYRSEARCVFLTAQFA